MILQWLNLLSHTVIIAWLVDTVFFFCLCVCVFCLQRKPKNKEPSASTPEIFLDFWPSNANQETSEWPSQGWRGKCRFRPLFSAFKGAVSLLSIAQNGEDGEGLRLEKVVSRFQDWTPIFFSSITKFRFSDSYFLKMAILSWQCSLKFHEAQKTVESDPSGSLNVVRWFYARSHWLDEIKGNICREREFKSRGILRSKMAEICLVLAHYLTSRGTIDFFFLLRPCGNLPTKKALGCK